MKTQCKSMQEIYMNIFKMRRYSCDGLETGASPSLDGQKERKDLKRQQDDNAVLDWKACSPATHSMGTASA